MTDEELLRYSRHILLEEVGVEGQARWGAAHALVIGAGGLGSPVALYLGSAGVGTLTLVDHDTVDLTNLQRQIAHNEARIGQPKAQSAAAAIAAINPHVKVHAVEQRAEGDLLDALVARADVVLDCCDNFVTRQAVNAACVTHRKPLVSGAAIRFDAQLALYDIRDENSPCYACIFPPETPPEETRCATLGVLAPLTGIVGSMQAALALNLLAGVGPAPVAQLQMLDARRMEWTQLRLRRNLHCPVCSSARAQRA
ncbi:MAG: molybdopterin-synthase adenylyltransferase MoeB [Betaproteobacteria bacterium]|jgi:molybdopterin-synthase adenylyltransferase|nr:molybdopterin-synthase adenylyltransferase MoeB [Betaproteobacteria bacterium]